MIKHKHQWSPWAPRPDYQKKSKLFFRYERWCHCGAAQGTSEVKPVGKPVRIAGGSL